MAVDTPIWKTKNIYNYEYQDKSEPHPEILSTGKLQATPPFPQQCSTTCRFQRRTAPQYGSLRL